MVSRGLRVPSIAPPLCRDISASRTADVQSSSPEGGYAAMYIYVFFLLNYIHIRPLKIKVNSLIKLNLYKTSIN